MHDAYDLEGLVIDADTGPVQPVLMKDEAIVLLGGSAKEVSRKIGITEQAVRNWPAVLSAKLRDRVQAALWREMVAAQERLRMQAEFERKRAERTQGNPNLPRITSVE